MILGLIFIFAAIIVIIIDVLDEDTKGLSFLVFVFSILGVAIAACECIEKDKSKNPQAIDVYRGNTILQITYKDSIPIDTVVVFKNK